MVAALLNGFLGLALCIGLNFFAYHWPVSDIFLFVFVSNLAALFSLLVTLKAERIQWLSKYFLNRSLKTWLLLSSIYLGILLGFCPPLRDPRSLLHFFFPLVLSTGFSILLFGPIQDFFVRRRQQKTH